MKRVISFIITSLLLIGLKGCNESRVLEENTKESGLSKYNVSYKSLDSDFFKEGYIFEPLYFKDDELYGIANIYYKSLAIEEEEEEDDNLKYKIDKDGNFKEYKNSLIDEYLNDNQIRDSISNKSVYKRGIHTQDINYYYSDFENDSIKVLEWLKEPIEIIKEKTERLDSESKFDNLVYKDKNIELHEVVTMNYKESNGTRIAYKENYKFLYSIDFNKEELSISDILKEEEGFGYYYNENIGKFIKVNKDGFFEELDLKDNKIEIKENKIENFKVNANYSFNYNFKDFTIITYNNRNEETNEPGPTQTMVINNKDNNYKIYYEDKDMMNDYIYLFSKIENSNYFIAVYNNKYYLSAIKDNLDLELIKEMNFNYEMYGDGDSSQMSIFANEEGNKALITITSYNFSKDDVYKHNKIQYIYLAIDEKE